MQPVFDRPGGPRPVELTPVGQVILDHTEQVFRRLAQAEEEVARLRAGDGGRLVVGTFQSVSVKVLPAVIRVLKAERPQLDIRLFEADDHDTIVERVLEGDLDLGFVVGEGFDERLDQVLLLEDPYLLISPRSDRPLPATFATGELSGAPLIGEAVSSCQAAIDHGLRMAGVEPSYVFRSNDNGAVQAMVRVGMGRAVLPVLAFDASDPDVVAQELDPPIPPRRISIIRRHARTLPPAADRFVEIASEVCAELSAAAPPVRAAS